MSLVCCAVSSRLSPVPWTNGVTTASPHRASCGMSSRGNPRRLAITRWGSGRAKRLMNSTVAVIDPLIDQLARVHVDHLPVAQRPRPDPRVGELLAVPDVELVRRAQRHHRRLHQVVVRAVGLLRRHALLGVATNSRLRQTREPLGIPHHAGDVRMLGEHERIGPGVQATALDAQHRRPRGAGSRTPRTSVPARRR